MTLQTAFLMQAKACQSLGSPFTAKVLRLCAANLDDSGAVGAHLFAWTGDITHRGASVPLRLMGALHALVLTGRSTALSKVYPPQDFNAPDTKLWQAIYGALKTHSGFILDWLKSPPQTNEPARSGALMPGFLEIAKHFNLPLVTSEIGASASLNQWWDLYQLNAQGQLFGAKTSALCLAPKWTGLLPPNIMPTLKSRAGCDLNRIDIHDPNGRLRLMSYIWPDQRDRLDRMTAALNITQAQPKTVVKADAIDWLTQRLAQPFAGAVHVIYNSIAWQYLPEDARNKGVAMIAKAGQSATTNAPLVWLQMEADDNPQGAAITLRIWPGNHNVTLGRADFHGRWVHWSGMKIPNTK